MSDLNVYTFTGRLGQEPELKKTGTGKSVTNLRVAVSLRGGGEEGSTLWLDVTAWESLAELCVKYLSKGRQVAITGYLSEDTWEDDEGRKRSKIKVTARDVTFMGSPTKQDEGSFKHVDPTGGEIEGVASEQDIDFEFPL